MDEWLLEEIVMPFYVVNILLSVNIFIFKVI